MPSAVKREIRWLICRLFLDRFLELWNLRLKVPAGVSSYQSCCAVCSSARLSVAKASSLMSLGLNR